MPPSTRIALTVPVRRCQSAAISLMPLPARYAALISSFCSSLGVVEMKLSIISSFTLVNPDGVSGGSTLQGGCVYVICDVEKYPPELRERAVRMVAECRHEHSSEWATIESVAAKLGIGTAQTLHAWVRREQVDFGRRVE